MIGETEEVPGFTDAPDEDESLTLTRLGRELVSVDTQIKDLEAALVAAKERRQEIAMKELPDYMTKIGQDRVGFPEFNCDLILTPYYHANIKSEWEEEKRQAAFQYLEERGDGDLIKTQLVFLFGRNEIEKVHWLCAFVKTLESYLRDRDPDSIGLPDPAMTMTVPWNTLTAFVKEQVEKGAPIDLDVLGATVGQIVKIKERKTR